MALDCAKGTLAIAAGATGAHSVTGLSFQPKAVIFFAAATNTTGSYVADEDIMLGLATSSTEERVIHASSNNQSTNTVTSRGKSNAACIRGMINGAPATIDFAADFTSFNSDGFTVNVSNSATNALTIHYLAFGGTYITNAKVGSITIPTSGSLAFTDPGFQPDMLLLAHTWPDGGSYRFSLSASDGTTSKMLHYGQISGSATVQSSVLQKTGALFTGATSAFGPDMDIGFVSFDATGFTLGGGTPDYPAATQEVYYLAIEGGQWEVGVDTEGTAAAARDTAVAFTPKGLLLFGMNETASATYKNTADGKLSIGASDGTNEGCVWNGNDDAHTDNPSFKRNDVARAFWHANPATSVGGPPTTVNEADCTFASNKFTLTWTQAGASREFIYLAAGDAAGGGTTYEKEGSLTASTSTAGPDAFQATEAGSNTTRAFVSGADVFQATETGALTSKAVLSGADVFNANETGALTSQAVLSGVSQFVSGSGTTYEKAGALAAGTNASGADSFTATETGSLSARTSPAGADAFTAAETATVSTRAVLSGVSQFVSGAGTTYEKAGALAAGTRTAGADSYTAVETGTLTAASALSGADSYTAVKVGAVTVGTSLSGEAEGAAIIVTAFFDQPTPNGGSDMGTPAAIVFNQPTPGGGVDEGTPGSTAYDQPTPEVILV